MWAGVFLITLSVGADHNVEGRWDCITLDSLIFAPCNIIPGKLD